MALDPLCIISLSLSVSDKLMKKSFSQGYMAVSDVGRMAMGSSRSDWPLHHGNQVEANCLDL